jgi:hypothetical protein
MHAIEIVVLPRQSMSWEEFCANTPPCSIALDGMVRGGPRWDEKTLHVNFDHHDHVLREATMSTAMQVYFAIKANLLRRFGERARVYVNDPDQDTALACWLLKHFKQFTGTQSHPSISRILTLTDRWDITGGAFPMSLDDQIVRQHSWVFGPYTDFRKSGELARAGEASIRNTLEAVFRNLDLLWLGQAQEKKLDDRYEILYTSKKFGFKIVDEIGGNEARYHLFSRGLLDDGFVSLVARRPDGRFVWSIGRPSPYVDFPVPDLYAPLNRADKLTPEDGWNGSNLIGGSSRLNGSALTWEGVRDTLEQELEERQTKRHAQTTISQNA